MPPTILKAGICLCEISPMARNGLEGYDKGCTYLYEYLDKDKNGKPYYRVFPEQGSRYYETCGVSTFKYFFKIEG